MKAVVDASVAVKWLFTEDGTVEARQLLAHRIMLHAPDFILTEAANVIWKKARRREVADAQPYLRELARLGDLVSLVPAAELVIHAAAIALRIDHPVYDCLYLACAEVEGAPLVTTDRRLWDAARTQADPEVRLISDSETGRRIASAATGL
ncbi:MAG: type II toxin-antitoxin system VapC family toxin, partial [Rhodospirillales bacterium]|nr:type II toxin-antitoxin system VapC family toxin [Rhodospirillales bacterium]